LQKKQVLKSFFLVTLYSTNRRFASKKNYLHMKIFTKIIFLSIMLLGSKTSISQNLMLNVLTLNSGVVNKNKITFLEITISNTSATKVVPTYKLRPQISFPYNLVSIPDTGHILPKGWAIISNKNGVVWLSNGTDVIAENDSRTILIAMKGKQIGSQSTILGNLSFSNGKTPGNIIGAPTIGDNPADNSSSSSIMVIK
jgi:hypothetical protein